MIIEKFNVFRSKYIENYKCVDVIICFIILLFYISILWNTSVAKNCYYALSLLSIYFIATRQISFKIFKLEKLFLWAIAAGFIWIVIAYFVNDMPEKGGSWILNRQLRLFFVIPIYLMLRSRPIPGNIWLYIVGLGSITSGIVGIFDVSWVGGWPSGRADGDTSAIFFGEISLCLAFITLIGIKFYFSTGVFKILFWFISVNLGLLAMILSGTRSAWIAIPFLLIISFLYLTKNILFYKKIYILLILLIIPISLFQFPYAQDRYNEGVTNLGNYIKSNNILDPVRKTNVGLRLDTWQAMLITIKNNPFFGIGIGGFDSEIKHYIDVGLVNPDAYKLPHSHNQYIEMLLYGGILGLIINLAILVLPSIIFVKHIKSGNYESHFYAVAGLLLVTGYLLFGLTDLTLARKDPIIFFGLSISILLSLTYKHIVGNGEKINDHPARIKIPL